LALLSAPSAGRRGVYGVLRGDIEVKEVLRRRLSGKGKQWIGDNVGLAPTAAWQYVRLAGYVVYRLMLGSALSL
jgi:hypothetical protein